MRLSTMVRYGAELPIDVIEQQIASALGCLIQIVRDAQGHRYLSEICELSYDRAARQVLLNCVFKRDRYDQAGKWHSVPCWIEKLRASQVLGDEEVRQWYRLTQA